VINWWQRSDDLWPCDRGHIETDCLSWISRKKDGEDQQLIIQCNLSNEPLSTPYKVTNYVQSLLRFLSFLTSSIKVFVSSTCNLTRKNCFRYLKLMSPLNAAKNVMARARKILFKKQLFDLEVKGQCPTKVKMVRDTALWSCTHIPNIIDLSRKTKMLWPRQENTI
jgi:hypothetical protein